PPAHRLRGLPPGHRRAPAAGLGGGGGRGRAGPRRAGARAARAPGSGGALEPGRPALEYGAAFESSWRTVEQRQAALREEWLAARTLLKELLDLPLERQREVATTQ